MCITRIITAPDAISLCAIMRRRRPNPDLQPTAIPVMVDSSDAFNRIWRTVADIPAGRVATYGEVARLAGLPRRARLVGQALHVAPDHLDLPWHRVINARGRISLPPTSAGHKRQRCCLEAEGVVFVGGRVDLARFGWSASLDELLWKP